MHPEHICVSKELHETPVPNWKLMYSIESGDGTSVREYLAKSPVPGRMYQLRIVEYAAGSFGTYSVTR